MTERETVAPIQPSLVPSGPAERLAAVGALLFVATEPVPLATLAHQIQCSQDELRDSLVELRDRIAPIGLQLQWLPEDMVQLVTSPAQAVAIQRFLGLQRTVRLSQAALEALAIVAYHQPVTRTTVDTIRGVDSSGVLQTLLARGMVEPVGRLSSVGSPVVYGTTAEFLRFFGLERLEELPPLPDDLAALLASLTEVGPDVERD